MTAIAKNYINRISLLLDASSSMEHLQGKVVQAADDLVKFLADESKRMNQETRVSIYSFADVPVCHVWDTDVLRLPSMKEYYKVYGWTALLDAVHLALSDSELVTEKYGEHGFLFYVLTDGEENRSKGLGRAPAYGHRPKSVLAAEMSDRLKGLPENRAVALLVPNEAGVREAKSFGFSEGNIAIWDAATEEGMEAAAQTIRASATTYMQSRTEGAVGLRNMRKGGLFVGANVNAKAVKAANLTPLPSSARKITRVVQSDDSFEKEVKPANSRRAVAEMGWFVKIEDWVKRVNKGEYPLGDAFFELVKTERVQGDKEIAVVEVNTNKVFVGDGARQLLGLPDHVVSVKPDMNPDYTIFIQSNSVNRHLPHGSQVMVLKR